MRRRRRISDFQLEVRRLMLVRLRRERLNFPKHFFDFLLKEIEFRFATEVESGNSDEEFNCQPILFESWSQQVYPIPPAMRNAVTAAIPMKR